MKPIKVSTQYELVMENDDEYPSFHIAVTGFYYPEEPDGWTTPGVKPFVEITSYEVDGLPVDELIFQKAFGLDQINYAELKLSKSLENNDEIT